MSKYIRNKLFYAFSILIGVILLVFFLFYALKIDPTKASLDQRSDAKTRKAIMEKYGLDKAWYQRFYAYIGDLSPLWVYDNNASNKAEYRYRAIFGLGHHKVLAVKAPYFGRSMQSGRRVSEMIGKGLKNSAILAITAMIFALFWGLCFGALAAVYKDSLLDRIVIALSAIGVSIPSYFSAILLSIIFGYMLKSFTGLNMIGSLYDLEGHLTLKNLILPALALGIRPIAIITQLSRNAMLEVLYEDYIRTAYAKGLSKLRVIYHHALRNALNPVVTSVSGWFASLLAGAYFVEIIFNFKGLGYETVKAIESNDFPVILASVLAAALIFVLINFAVDLSYVWIDPRVKITGKAKQ